MDRAQKSVGTLFRSHQREGAIGENENSQMKLPIYYCAISQEIFGDSRDSISRHASLCILRSFLDTLRLYSRWAKEKNLTKAICS